MAIPVLLKRLLPLTPVAVGAHLWPTTPAKHPCSFNFAFRVACEWKQPCSSLSHITSSLSQPKHIVSLLWHSPVHYKYSTSLPHKTCTHFSKQHIGKYPPRAPIYTLHHLVYAIEAPLQWCSVLARPRRLTHTCGPFSRLPALHWGDTRVLDALTQSAQAFGSFNVSAMVHW